jgi:lipopolysaccharide biosynthesis regulator YciM
VGWLTRAFGGNARGPRDVDSALRAALLAILDSDFDRAEELLTRAVRLDADGVESYLALARVYRRRGETGRAIRVHQNLLLRNDLKPDQRRTVLVDLGEDYLQGGHAERARASFEEVLADGKNHRRALEALVGLYAGAGEHTRAANLARRVAKIDGANPAEAEAPLLLAGARAAHKDGRQDEARRLVKKTLRRDKHCIGAWILLGDLEAERGRSKAALAAWRKVPELELASGGLVYTRLAATFAALDRAPEFEIYLRELRNQHPEDSASRRALAASLARRGDDSEARAELRRMVASNPDDVQAQAVLGRALHAEGARDEALRAYAALVDTLERQGLLGDSEKPT